jgi:aspartate racemase
MTPEKNILGVMGGMGPLASAEFLRTIYEYNLAGPEQGAPIVIMFSNPTFPDRTESLLEGSQGKLTSKMCEALERLCELGSSRIVICCVTSHYLLPAMPAQLRKRIISLPEVILERAAASPMRRLMLCSIGTRRAKIFETHPLWDQAAEKIALPEEQDQEQIHEMIYELKQGAQPQRYIPLLFSLLNKYRAQSFIAGCTEIHLLSKQPTFSHHQKGASGCLDPLIVIAQSLMQDGRQVESRKNHETFEYSRAISSIR